MLKCRDDVRRKILSVITGGPCDLGRTKRDNRGSMRLERYLGSFGIRTLSYDSTTIVLSEDRRDRSPALRGGEEVTIHHPHIVHRPHHFLFKENL